jgi:hypothetical protein
LREIPREDPECPEGGYPRSIQAFGPGQRLLKRGRFPLPFSTRPDFIMGANARRSPHALLQQWGLEIRALVGESRCAKRGARADRRAPEGYRPRGPGTAFGSRPWITVAARGLFPAHKRTPPPESAREQGPEGERVISSTSNLRCSWGGPITWVKRGGRFQAGGRPRSRQYSYGPAAVPKGGID